MKFSVSLSVGFANIEDVNKLPPSLIDIQESFVLTGELALEVPNHAQYGLKTCVPETLKYYYLLFSDPELMSLDDYVFNTEA